jgi:hypothetical protein
MSDVIEPQEIEPAKLDDELSDEALDRETGNGAPFCCVSTRR